MLSELDRNGVSCLPAAAERAIELHERKCLSLLRVDQIQLGGKEV